MFKNHNKISLHNLAKKRLMCITACAIVIYVLSTIVNRSSSISYWFYLFRFLAYFCFVILILNEWYIAWVRKHGVLHYIYTIMFIGLLLLLFTSYCSLAEYKLENASVVNEYLSLDKSVFENPNNDEATVNIILSYHSYENKCQVIEKQNTFFLLAYSITMSVIAVLLYFKFAQKSLSETFEEMIRNATADNFDEDEK